MAQPFLGEIAMFAGNFAPRGYAFCNGQTLAIQQNTALFSLLGTFYGGNGTSTFALPNLQGRAPLSSGTGPGLTPRTVGEIGGSENVTLLTTQMPAHTHPPAALSSAGGQTSPATASFATILSGRTAAPLYTNTAPNVTMNPSVVGVTGGSQPHQNMPPYLAINFIIALQGVFPPRN